MYMYDPEGTAPKDESTYTTYWVVFNGSILEIFENRLTFLKYS